MNLNPFDPLENAPLSVQSLRVLGKGRAATARLVDATFADGSTIRCVEKVFTPGWLTRTIYRLSFFAPFAYQSNRDAITACFFRRRVASEILRRDGINVDVAKPLYIRFDSDALAWVLAAEHIEGRGIRPAGRHETNPEIDQIVALMHTAKQSLIDAGLTGSGWQIDPRAMVSTANLLRLGDRYTIIDLESGIPAILVPKYLLLAARTGTLPPFDDLDAAKLKSRDPDLAGDVDALIHYTSEWKNAEPAPLRFGTWRRIVDKTRHRLLRSTRTLWRFLTHRRYQTYIGLRYIRQSILRWQSEQRISDEEAARLSREIDGAEVSAYARGMALHLAIKSLSPMMVPAKYGGAAATLASGNVWFLLPWLLLPLARTIVTLVNWLRSGRNVRHVEALCVGIIPTAGSLAFPIQMFARRPALATFLIRNVASSVGRRIPIYGGKDSRTEIALIGWSDRLIVALRWMFGAGPVAESESECDRRDLLPQPLATRVAIEKAA